MKFRLLVHEKETDTIAIGCPVDYSDIDSIEELTQRVKEDHVNFGFSSDEDFGEYWVRVSIVDPDSLTTLADIYKEI